MAHMIPIKPREYDPASKEGVVFNAFKKLPDDYYVFHSVTIAGINSTNHFYEREMDFVIANPKKGVMAIEVKAGNNITYRNGTWYYSNGDRMHHEGPYNQAATAKRKLIDRIKDHRNELVKDIAKHCKFMHAVCFVDMSSDDFGRMSGLPTEADIRITICTNDLANPTKKIAEIFSAYVPGMQDSENKMSDEEFQLLLDEVLCPHFRMIPSTQAKTELIEERMNQLLREQYLILDFLDEQQTAVINGAAGTGKTMLAVEKARQHSRDKEKVLFLCYNKLLCEKLIKDNKNCESKARRKDFENVDFMTISRLANKVTQDYRDYAGLYDWLIECIDRKKELGYKHIIVDEGQDFGLVDEKVNNDSESSTSEENVSIIDALQEAALEQGGTFYLFYDKYQMIQGGSNVTYNLPSCIENSDCRLTLHKNCRNTKEIARTSVTPLKDKKNKIVKTSVADSWEAPVKPVLHFAQNNVESILDSILVKLEEYGAKEVMILTPESFEKSGIFSSLKFSADSNDSYAYYDHEGKEYRVTTCIRFKGLETDAIVMVGLDKESFIGKKGMEFYVGASRAKHYLDIICNISETDYKDLVHSLDENAPQRNNAEVMKGIIGEIFAAKVE